MAKKRISEKREVTLQVTVTKRTKALVNIAIKNSKKTISNYINRLITIDTSGLEYIVIDATNYIINCMLRNMIDITNNGNFTIVKITGILQCEFAFENGKIKTYEFSSNYEEVQNCSIKFDIDKIESHFKNYIK